MRITMRITVRITMPSRSQDHLHALARRSSDPPASLDMCSSSSASASQSVSSRDIEAPLPSDGCEQAASPCWYAAASVLYVCPLPHRCSTVQALPAEHDATRSRHRPTRYRLAPCLPTRKPGASAFFHGYMWASREQQWRVRITMRNVCTHWMPQIKIIHSTVLLEISKVHVTAAVSGSS